MWDDETDDDLTFRDLATSDIRARDLGDDVVAPFEASADDHAGDAPTVIIPDPDQNASAETSRQLGGGAVQLDARSREDLRAMLAHLPRATTTVRALGPKARRGGVCVAILIYCDGRREVLK